MHERTQRAVARLLFVFCCAVPTALIVFSILVTWTPWYHSRRMHRINQILSRETGLLVQMDACREVAPDKFILENVRLDHPESKRNVATIRLVDWLVDGEETRVVLHQPELQGAAIGDAWKLLHDRLISRPQSGVQSFKLVASRLTVRGAGGSMTRDIEASISPKEDGVLMVARAATDPGQTNSYIQATLFRDRGGNKPLTSVSLSTHDAALPCSALDDYFPWLRRLGADAEFSGSMEFKQLAEGGWSYNFDSSTLDGIELSRLCENLPHRVTGVARLHLTRCLIHPGQSVNLAGELTIPKGGWIGRSLLQTMAEEIGIRINPAADFTVADNVQYSNAAMKVSITNERMTVRGLCRPHQDFEGALPDVAFCQYGRPLVQAIEQGFAADTLTTIFSPPRAELTSWSSILLPSPRTPRIATESSAGIRAAGAHSGGPTIYER